MIVFGDYKESSEKTIKIWLICATVLCILGSLDMVIEIIKLIQGIKP